MNVADDPVSRAGEDTPRVLIIVAHPDDETFGCGSLLLRAAASGARTVVVCATAGESGDVVAGVNAPDGVAALRTAELNAAAEALGVDQVDLLTFEDSGMNGVATARSLSGAPEREVRDAVQKALDDHRPTLVLTLDGGDGHRDHVRLRAVVEDLLAGGPVPLYLHCLPRSLMHAWVKHHAGDDGAAAYTGLPDIGTPDDQITTVLDQAPYLASRELAISLHRSQRSPFDGLPSGLREAFLAQDHLIRVNPPWRGGPREQELTGLRPRRGAEPPVTGPDDPTGGC